MPKYSCAAPSCDFQADSVEAAYGHKRTTGHTLELMTTGSGTPGAFGRVSWGFAFGRGFVIFLWTIVWGIIGGVIGWVIVSGTVGAALTDLSAFATNPGAFILALFLGVFVGALVPLLGIFATIVKVTVESSIQQALRLGNETKRNS